MKHKETSYYETRTAEPDLEPWSKLGSRGR